MKITKKWTKGKGFVGFFFDHRGIRTMENYSGGDDHWAEGQEIFENGVFPDKLKYMGYVMGYEQGRSRVNVVFHSKKFDARIYMFMEDFNEMMLEDKAEILDGKVEGNFTFVKLGTNYGMRKVIDAK